jgi:protein-S-isoprenylcysteine O-methyltransferase Ste14
MMILATDLIPIFWIIFGTVWLVSAFSAKKTVQFHEWWRSALVRILLLIFVIWIFSFSHNTNFFAYHAYEGFVPGNLMLGIIGTVLCGAGIAFAIWARFHLGRNWGMPMTLRENPELVTSGPYRFVRHPIYTGVLTAMLGNAVAFGIFWFAIFIFFAMYFIYSATKEERMMAKQFPNQYPAYKQRTKMIVPFVL